MTKRRDAASESPPKAGKSGLMRCAWETGAARCLLVADGEIRGEDKSRHGYCLWHELCLDDPRISDEFPAFEGWLDGMRHYCVVWTHYDSAYLWELVQGRPPPYRLPDPCRVASCRYRPAAPEAPTPGKLRELIARLSVRFDAAPPSKRR